MVIKNISQSNTLSTKAKIASSFSDRLFGLLNPKNPLFLVIKTRFGIHTLFMKQPIDIVILDTHSKVVIIKKQLQPFRLFFYPPIFNTVIEMPQGSIKKYHLAINDKISIEWNLPNSKKYLVVKIFLFSFFLLLVCLLRLPHTSVLICKSLKTFKMYNRIFSAI